jgi:hypothetical protein
MPLMYSTAVALFCCSADMVFKNMYFFFLICAVELGYCSHYWPIVPAPDDRWGWLWKNWWNENWQGKPKYSEKTCPTNPTWLNLGLNPGRRGGKPATNRLSYGPAISRICILDDLRYIEFNLEKSHIYYSHKFYFIIVEYKFISYEILIILPSILPLPPLLSVLIVLLVIIRYTFTTVRRCQITNLNCMYVLLIY